METAEIFCSNILPTKTAFGIRSDNGEQVFIPSTVTTASGLEVNDLVTAMIVPNKHHAERTPWFAVSVEKGQKTEPDLDKRILSFVGSTSYVATSEVVEEFNIDSITASTTLNRLFRQGKLAKADVYASADQARVSFCLWAVNAAKFVEME